MPNFVDRVAPQASWRRTHALADAAAPSVERALQRALSLFMSSKEIGDAIKQGNLDLILNTVLADMQQELHDTVITKLVSVFIRSGNFRQAMQKAVRKPKPKVVTTAVVSSGFDATNPNVVKWAQNYAAKLVGNISHETRKTLRAILADAYRKNQSIPEITRRIQRVVGLTERQVASMERQRRDMEEAGVKRGTVERRIEFMSRQARRERAKSIARTETIRASNAGQVESWNEARDEGYLSDELVKEWITTPDDRLCEECEALDGEQRELDEDFSAGVSEPPLHPNCRCAIGLVRAK